MPPAAVKVTVSECQVGTVNNEVAAIINHHTRAPLFLGDRISPRFVPVSLPHKTEQ